MIYQIKETLSFIFPQCGHFYGKTCMDEVGAVFPQLEFRMSTWPMGLCFSSGTLFAAFKWLPWQGVRFQKKETRVFS